MAEPDVDRFHAAVRRLQAALAGGRTLGAASARDGWPLRGVYLFLDPREAAPDGGARVVRVGTHALKAGSRSTLWGRLSQHRGVLGGASAGGGNHRGSIFRLHVGEALLAADPSLPRVPTWGVGGSAPRGVRDLERDHERRVSDYIRALTVVWLDVDDPPGPGSERGLLERGSIALLAGPGAGGGLASPAWLGRHSMRAAIRESGLWNVNHVGERPPPDFLDRFEDCVGRMEREGRLC